MVFDVTGNNMKAILRYREVSVVEFDVKNELMAMVEGRRVFCWAKLRTVTNAICLRAIEFKVGSKPAFPPLSSKIPSGRTSYWI